MLSTKMLLLFLLLFYTLPLVLSGTYGIPATQVRVVTLERVLNVTDAL